MEIRKMINNIKENMENKKKEKEENKKKDDLNKTRVKINTMKSEYTTLLSEIAMERIELDIHIKETKNLIAAKEKRSKELMEEIERLSSSYIDTQRKVFDLTEKEANQNKSVLNFKIKSDTEDKKEEAPKEYLIPFPDERGK